MRLLEKLNYAAAVVIVVCVKFALILANANPLPPPFGGGNNTVEPSNKTNQSETEP